MGTQDGILSLSDGHRRWATRRRPSEVGEHGPKIQPFAKGMATRVMMGAVKPTTSNHVDSRVGRDRRRNIGAHAQGGRVGHGVWAGAVGGHGLVLVAILGKSGARDGQRVTCRPGYR